MTDPNKDYPQCSECDARDVPLRYASVNPKTRKPEGAICEECYRDPSTDAEAGPAFDDCAAANEEAAIEDERWKDAIAARRITPRVEPVFPPESKRPQDERCKAGLEHNRPRDAAKYPDRMTRPDGTRQGDE